MLQSLIRSAQRSVDGLVSKYVSRAAVAIPFVIAGGFAAAALTVKLSQDYGPITAYASLAALFAAAGVVTALLLGDNGRKGEAELAVADTPSDARSSAEPASTLDRDTVISLLTQLAPIALPVLARTFFGRRPIVIVGLLIVAYLFLRSSNSDSNSPTAAGMAADT